MFFLACYVNAIGECNGGDVSTGMTIDGCCFDSEGEYWADQSGTCNDCSNNGK